MTEESGLPTLREFGAVAWRDWGSRVSGGFSIPFTILALFSKADYAKAIWGALAAFGIVATAYQVWAKERTKVRQLESDLAKERDYARPQLEGTIEQTFAGSPGSGTIAHINISILNKGFATIVHQWSASVKVEGIIYSTELQVVGNSTRLMLADGEVTLNNADGMYEKTLTPIPRGGLQRGWLRLFVPAAAPNHLMASGAEWTISFQDFLGIQYTAKHLIQERNLQTSPLYYPDGRGPR